MGENIIMSDDKLIPESIVKLLFDQVKEAAEKNNEAIRDLSGGVRELHKIISTLPTRQEFVSEIKSHEQACAKKEENLSALIDEEKIEISNKVIAAIGKVETNATKLSEATNKLDNALCSITDQKSILKSINDGIGDVAGKIKTMIIVVCVAFSVTMLIFYFVKSANDVLINNSIKQAVKEIITTRPSNVWPQVDDGDDKK